MLGNFVRSLSSAVRSTCILEIGGVPLDWVGTAAPPAGHQQVHSRLDEEKA